MKKTRVTIGISILFFLFAFSAMVVAAEKAKKDDAPKVDSTKVEKARPAAKHLIVYYVHGTRRCVTCKKLEAYTQEAVESGFADELKAGTIVWKPVNSDEKGNEHFIDDYQLYTKSVVLSEVADGKELRWKNLDKIWQLVRGDKAEYTKYIQDEVKAFLAGS